MGIVYRAVGPDGPVALKVLRAALSGPQFRRRFEREALIRVEHENVARLLDAGTDEQGTHYIAFELLLGESLDEVFARGAPSAADLVSWGAQAARGLSAAHAAGIVHRDVKPSNLFLDGEGTVKVLDFGIARVDDGRTQLTATGAVPGTVGYLAPEQAEGHVDIDARADQWALGSVLYAGFAGLPPFARESPLATLVATLMADLIPLRSQAREVPVALAAVIQRALSRKPDGRYPTMEAFAEALEGADLSASAAQVSERPSMLPGERRVIAILLAIGVRDVDAIRDAVHAERGTFHSLAGGRGLGVFGDASWEGDEIGRAAAAALRARDATDSVSVATGWATSTGPGFSGRALDAAERSAAARLGGVGLDAEAARHLQDHHTVERVGEGVFELFGDAAPRAVEIPLVDREAELAQLRQGLDAVVGDGRAGVTIIEGPLGIGKARLVAEARRFAEEVTPGAKLVAAAGTAPTHEADLSLLRRLLADLVGVEGEGQELLPALRGAISSALGRGPVAAAHADALDELMRAGADSVSGVGNDVVFVRDRSRLAALEWLESLAAQATLVLCVEDLHWADDASVELLEELVFRCEDRPLWVLATRRPELAPLDEPFTAASPQKITPRGLTRRGVSTLAASVAGRAVAVEVAARIHERSAGNPYFAIQCVRALAEDDALDDAPDALPLPATVEAAIQSRLDHLPESTRAFCGAVSVWERPFSELEAAAVSAEVEGSPSDHLEALASRGLSSVRGRRPRVTHRLSSLVREVAYRSLSAELAPAHHRRAATFLVGSALADPEERGRHHALAREDALASRAFVEAAHVAIRRGDAHTTLRVADSALALGVPEADAFDLHALRVDALRFLGEHEAHGLALEEALAAAIDDRQEARALSEKAVWLWRRGRLDEAVPVAEASVVAGRASGDREALVLARGRQYLVLFRMGRGAEAEAALAEAVELSDGQSRSLRATVLSWRAHHLGITGALSERVSAFVELAELYESLEDRRRLAGTRANLADVYNRLGAFGAAAESLESAIDDCRRVGHRTMEGYSLANLAYAKKHMADAGGALTHLEAAAKIAEETSEVRLLLLTGVYRASSLLVAGRPDDAASEAERVATEAHGHAMPDLEMNALTALSEAKRALGDLDEALDASSRALALYDSLEVIEEGEAEVFAARVGVLRHAGRPDEAAEVQKRGVLRLRVVADAIDDDELRRGFLAIPAVAALMQD